MSTCPVMSRYGGVIKAVYAVGFESRTNVNTVSATGVVSLHAQVLDVAAFG